MSSQSVLRIHSEFEENYQENAKASPEALIAQELLTAGLERARTYVPSLIDLDTQRLRSLKPHVGCMSAGILCHEAGGINNFVYLPERTKDMELNIHVRGHNNILIIEEGANLRSKSMILIEGSNGVCIIRKGEGSSKVKFLMCGPEAMVIWGKNCTANDVYGIAHAAPLTFGNDCMLSWGITVRTFDSHAIIDCSSGAQINTPKPVHIDDHVWIAQDSMVMPGVSIGSGSIVGASSLVTKNIPPRTLVAGVAAKPLRENVTWHRSSSPNEHEIQSVIKQVANT